MATLLEKCNLIQANKEANLKPENLRAGVTCLGVEGTMTGGVDTSDATATPDDVISGKTAYVDGVKIEGTIFDARPAEGSSTYVTAAYTKSSYPGNGSIRCDANMLNTKVVGNGTVVEMDVPENDVASLINLTPDKIVSGNTILGVEGTAVVGGNTIEGVKLFTSVEEMHADLEKQEGDLAVVYGEKQIGLPSNIEFNYIHAPYEVPCSSNELPETGIEISFQPVNGEGYGSFECTIMEMDTGLGIEKDYNIEIRFYDGNESYNISYYDSGNKFRRSYTDPDLEDNETLFALTQAYITTQEIPDFVKKFMLIDQMQLQGVYEVQEGEYKLAKTQFTATEQNVYDGIITYGEEGIITGALGTIAEDTFDDVTAEVYTKIQKLYNDIPTFTITNENIGTVKEKYKNALFIPKKTNGTSALEIDPSVTSLKFLFHNCEKLQSIDLSGFDTSNVTNMESVFYACRNLQTLDLSNLNTSNVTDMSGLFGGCNSLKTLDLNYLDTSKVTDMGGLFSGCDSLESIDLSNWNASELTNISAMFQSCTSLKSLDLSCFNVSKLTDIYWMFSGCTSLESLNVSGWDTSRVTSLRDVFFNCNKLKTLDLSGWDTSSMTNMDTAFTHCKSLEMLDISNFTFDNVTSANSMFNYIPANCLIYVKSQTEKDWVLQQRNDFTNVQIKVS